MPAGQAYFFFHCCKFLGTRWWCSRKWRWFVWVLRSFTMVASWYIAKWTNVEVKMIDEKLIYTKT